MGVLLSAGSRPKRATKVKKEMTTMAMIVLRNATMILLLLHLRYKVSTCSASNLFHVVAAFIV